VNRVSRLNPNYDQRWSEWLKFEEKFFLPISIGHNLFKMTDFSYGEYEILKISQISVKLCTRGFSWPLITNLTTNFQNLKWRIQYSGHEILKISQISVILYSGVFVVTDYEFDILLSAWPRNNDVDVVEFCLLQGAWLEWVPLPLTFRGACVNYKGFRCRDSQGKITEKTSYCGYDFIDALSIKSRCQLLPLGFLLPSPAHC